MIGDWDNFMVNTVSFKTVPDTSDTSGDAANGTPSAGTILSCSVQSAREARDVDHGAVLAVATHSVFFSVEPLDISAGARADGHCRPMDLFVWHFDPLDSTRTKTLYALGPAVDMAGWGECWRVDCKLTS